MKKLRPVFLLVLLCALFTLPAHAAEIAYPVEGGNIYFGERTGEIRDADPLITRADIPAEINGVPVTAIRSFAFEDCKLLTSVSIPESVISIGGFAFDSCSSLSSVTIPGSVSVLGNYAFTHCDSLSSVTLSKGVETIDKGAFSNCSLLSSIVIPDTVTTIGGFAFSDCSRLSSIVIPDSVVSIGEYAFYNCAALTSVTIPDGVRFIDDRTFNHCTSLRSVVIPDGVSFIGDYAFSDCTRLSAVTIPDSVTSIGEFAFCDCSSLSSIVIPNSVTSIGKAAFQGCSALASVVIFDSVTYIGEHAFNSCTSLSSFVIPGYVPSIGEGTFANCSSLSSIVIPNSVTFIGKHAFNRCTSLPSVAIPDSVTSIEMCAFYGCSSLTSVTIPASVTSIGEAAFGVPFFSSGLSKVYFCGSAPSVVITQEDDLFPYNATLYYTPDTAGWTDSPAYDPATGMWNGRRLKVWTPLPFTDITEGETFYEDILWVYEEGLMNGKTAATFERKTNLTRQQVWRVLFRAVTGSDAGSMAAAKAWAVNAGLADGTLPGADATRQEVITMMWKALGSPPADTVMISGYTDAASVAADSRAAMAWAVQWGLVSGYADNTLRPNATITRGAFAALLHRQLG